MRLNCLVALLATFCVGQPVKAEKFSAVVAFGDSLSDLGNTFNYLGDYTSYWLADYNSYYYDQGRWSDGPVWVEDLVRLFHFAALQPNNGFNLYGTDFAWGGSTSGDGYTSFTVLGLEYELPNLQTQVENYLNLFSTEYARMPDISERLFTIWSGGNDVIYLVQGLPGTSKKLEVTPEDIAKHIDSAVSKLYQAGGRYFLVPNLPPLGEKPNYRTIKDYRREANDFVNQYTPLIHAELVQLPQKLSGATVVELDVFKLFTNVIKYPDNYGFTNVKVPAFTSDLYNPPHFGKIVRNPSQYLFWDGTHPTLVGHEIVGKSAYDAVQAASALLLSMGQ